MLNEILQGCIDVVAAVLSSIVGLFPTSPFQLLETISIDNSMLAALSWLVPFPQIIAILEAWGLAIAVYYCWMTIARWIKLLG